MIIPKINQTSVKVMITENKVVTTNIVNDNNRIYMKLKSRRLKNRNKRLKK